MRGARVRVRMTRGRRGLAAAALLLLLPGLAGVEARLRQIEQEGCPAVHDIVVRAIDAYRVASIRAILPTDAAMQPLFEELEAYVARYGARADGPPLAVYYDADYRAADIDVEVAVPVAWALPASARVTVRTLPAVPRAACVVHAGGYAALPVAAGALLAWLGANHSTPSGPLREVYLRFGAAMDGIRLPPAYLAGRSDEYVTELQQPVTAE